MTLFGYLCDIKIVKQISSELSLSMNESVLLRKDILLLLIENKQMAQLFLNKQNVNQYLVIEALSLLLNLPCLLYNITPSLAS